MRVDCLSRRDRGCPEGIEEAEGECQKGVRDRKIVGVEWDGMTTDQFLRRLRCGDKSKGE